MRTVLFIDLGLCVAVGLFYWLADWSTAYQYGTGLIWAGVGALLLGVLSMAGSVKQTGDVRYQYLRTVDGMSSREGIQQDLNYMRQTLECLFLMLIAGMVSIALGILIQVAFG